MESVVLTVVVDVRVFSCTDIVHLDVALAQQWGVPDLGGEEIADVEAYLEIQSADGAWHRFRCRPRPGLEGSVEVMKMACRKLGFSAGEQVPVRPVG